MKRYLLIFFATLLVFPLSAQKENLLSGKYSVDELQNLLIPRSQWKPFPPLADREGWAKADSATMRQYIDYAESNIDYDWPTVPATLSLLIARTGNRSEYQKVSYRKRIVLCNMILAELAENKGRFIDPVINGIWSICEESWWGAAAHLPQTPEYAGLTDVTKPFVDLYSGVTGGVLAWADYFLGEKFDAVSPQIRKRIRHEVNFRILQPLMTQYHAWMGKNANGRPPNNWNPWICSNWLTCALLLEDDNARRAAMTARALKVLDEFVNPYPADGGCSEGPGYWGAAVGCLYNNIALLNEATDGAFCYIFEHQKFRNMCSFVYKVQISETYFVNFADAGPRMTGPNNLAYRIGKDIGDADMMRFGAWFFQTGSADYVRAHFANDFFDLFIINEIRHAQKGLAFPQDVWFPNLQVALARDKGGSTRGFFFAAKGGTNNESHNHNDVGSFIVYYDGLPLIIDVGNPKYTAKTFTDKRYEIWNLCSDYHNLPTVNGINESVGAQFMTTDVTFKAKKTKTSFTLDIAHAYPTEAGINSWKRTITLNRGKDVVVKDVTNLKKVESITWHLMTCHPVNIGADGRLRIAFRNNKGEETSLYIEYDVNRLKAEVEKIELGTESDEAVIANWGDNIRRINLKAINPKTNDKFSFKISSK